MRVAVLHTQLTAGEAAARQTGAAAAAAAFEEAATALAIGERYQILLTYLAALACMCVARSQSHLPVVTCFVLPCTGRSTSRQPPMFKPSNALVLSVAKPTAPACGVVPLCSEYAG